MNSLLIAHPSYVKTEAELREFAKGVNDLRSMGLSGRALLSSFGILTWDEYQDGIERCKKAGIEIDDTETFPNDEERIMEVEAEYRFDQGDSRFLVIKSMKFKALHARLTSPMYKHFGHAELDKFIRRKVFGAQRRSIEDPWPEATVTVHILKDGSYDVLSVKLIGQEFEDECV